MADKTVEIALLGLGTVGGGVARILLDNAELIAQRTGIRLEIAHVIELDAPKAVALGIPEKIVHADIDRVVADPEVSIVVELFGGIDKTVEVVKKFLAGGKDVVTANKALLAERGEEVYAAARNNGRCIAFEASCCGGIPLISSIRTGLAANRIREMVGIVNGTCNYILSSMSDEGKEYEVALKEAQAAGYAEADPTLDVNGADSAHKIAILAALAFGKQIAFNAIRYTGIEDVHLADIKYGQELDYSLKLLAIASQNDKGLDLAVQPTFVHNENPLAQVRDAFNAVSIYGEEVGHTFYYGRGAGRFPTASAVVADIIEVARCNSAKLFGAMPGFGRPAEAATLCPPTERVSRYYLRLTVLDQSGVLAKVSKILGDNGISITSCLQHEMDHPSNVPLIITTHQARQGDMDLAVQQLGKLEVIGETPICIPIMTEPNED